MDKIDWYCDKCGCYMNDQEGFDTSTGRWICAECGYENDVSENNIRKKGVHVFRCTKLGWEHEVEGVWFDADEYDRYSAEAEFTECTGYTEKANGETYPYTYYEYDGEKYYEIEYMGEYDYDDMPHGYSGHGLPW